MVTASCFNVHCNLSVHSKLVLVSGIFSSLVKEMFIWQSHIYVHICALVLACSLLLNWNNSPDYIFCWVIQCFLPILSSIIFVQSICQGHQITEGAEFCGWGYWMFCDWSCWVLCAWGCWVFCGHILGCSLCLLPSQSSSCSSSFLQIGAMQYQWAFLCNLLWHHHHRGLLLLGVGLLFAQWMQI